MCNCGGSHSAVYNGCSCYVERQTIIKHKTENITTYEEAVKRVQKANEKPKAFHRKLKYMFQPKL